MSFGSEEIDDACADDYAYREDDIGDYMDICCFDVDVIMEIVV